MPSTLGVFSRHAFHLLTIGLTTALFITSASAAEPAAIHRYDVGGYKLSIVTHGSGGPTVVIVPGFGDAAIEGDEWNAVVDEVAKTNLVCVYDRLGLGSSDPFPDDKPRDSRDAASDLHNLLKAAKIPGPVVLVGQSIGGLFARVYAAQYPDEVAGIVLVDSTDPDQDTRWLAAMPAQKAGEDPSLTEARTFLKNRLADIGKNPEHLNIQTTYAQARDVQSFGSKPLAVLTHSPSWKFIPNMPDEILKPLEQVDQDLQKEMAKLSTDSTHRIAKSAGHHIHVEDPQLVISAIHEVTAKVKAKPAGR